MATFKSRPILASLNQSGEIVIFEKQDHSFKKDWVVFIIFFFLATPEAVFIEHSDEILHSNLGTNILIGRKAIFFLNPNGRLFCEQSEKKNKHYFEWSNNDYSMQDISFIYLFRDISFVVLKGL